MDQPNDEIEMGIYIKRVLYVMERTINRINLIGLLQCLINDHIDNLEKEFTVEELGKIRKVGNKYQEILSESSSVATLDIPNLPLSEESSKDFLFLDEDGDPKLHDIILLLEEKFGKAESFEYLMTSELKLFKKYLQDLRDGMEVKLGENSEQAKEREKMMRVCHYKNEQTKKDIAAIEDELRKKKTELNATLIGKSLIISRCKAKIEGIEKDAKDALLKKENEIKTEIKEVNDESKVLEEELKFKFKSVNSYFENSLKEHLAIEMKLRTQRLKVENQLVAMIQKFDEEMHEKQIEEEACQAELDEDQKKLQEIQNLLDEQADEYDDLMLEKEAEEQEQLEQKLFLFVLNRSARRIQRAFHAYKLKMLTKKKGKGKRSKKK